MRGSSAHATLLSAPLKLDHFERMCDDTGMMQHARYSIPDRNHGYCVDDVARGLQFLCHLYHRSSSDVNPQIDPAYREKELGLCRTMSIFLGFIGHAWNPQAKRFRNFLGFDRQWLEETGSEDAHGRTLWALATARMLAPLEADRKCAGVLFREGMEGVSDFTSPRAWAFIILACGEIRHNQLLSHACVPVLRDVADGLRRIFSEIIERRGAEQKWLWPEPVVTYANARLPHALLVAGDLLSDQGWNIEFRKLSFGLFHYLRTIKVGKYVIYIGADDIPGALRCNDILAAQVNKIDVFSNFMLIRRRHG